MAWFDLNSLQEQISKSVEDASAFVEIASKVEMFNLDDLAEKQEAEELQELEYDEEDEVIYEYQNPEPISKINFVPNPPEYQNKDDRMDEKDLDTKPERFDSFEDDMEWEETDEKKENLFIEKQKENQNILFEDEAKSIKLKNTSFWKNHQKQKSIISKKKPINELNKNVKEYSAEKPVVQKKSMILPSPAGVVKEGNDVSIIKKKKVKSLKPKVKQPKNLDFFGFSSNISDTNNKVDSSIERKDHEKGDAETGKAGGSLETTNLTDMFGDLFSQGDNSSGSTYKTSNPIYSQIQRLPQRLVTRISIGYTGSGSSYFDNVDDLDLEDDPILRQVKLNQTRPRSELRESLSLSAFTTRQLSMITNYMNSSTSPDSAMSSNSVGLNRDSSVEGDEMRDIHRTERQSNSSVGVLHRVLGFLFDLKRILRAACGRLLRSISSRNQQSGDNGLLMSEGQSFRHHLWEFLVSSNGLYILTAILFMYAYMKYRRYATDVSY